MTREASPLPHGPARTVASDLLPRRPPLLQAGRIAWALLGIAGVLVLVSFALSQVAVVVIPLLLALFPAAALTPAMGWLTRHRVPRPLGALLLVLAVIGAAVGIVAAVVPQFLAQLPALVESIRMSAVDLEPLLRRTPVIPDDVSLETLGTEAMRWLTGGDAISGAVGLTLGALEFLAGLALALIGLFFFLYDGGRLTSMGLSVLPRRHRASGAELGGRLWDTLGGFVRAQLMVALVDATLIGVGLALLGVPLALPLAVLVFLGAFFPYIGATTSGLLAVLVAFADGGPGLALAALVLVLAVQQIEGNLVEPLVAGRMVQLSAFTVIVAIAAGATLLGVLGAFLAVPVAACLARVVSFIRERREARQPDGAG